MPRYEYTCENCGCKAEEVRPMDERRAPLYCKCGGCMVLVPSAGYFTGSFVP